MARIIFMGTPEFAVPSLQALHREFGVQTVVTVPDKPRGRGLEVHPSEVKSAALELGITDILQPVSLRDDVFRQQITDRAPDIMCVIAFRILPKSVYSLASRGAFNVHASLLPRFRGAAPINHAIMSGDTESGVTSFLLNDVVDTGTILLQQRCAIDDGMTAGELYARLMPLAAECAVATTRGLLDQTISPLVQDDQLATPAPKVFRTSSALDLSQPRRTVRNMIHGLSPTPCAWTMWNGEMLKVYRASLADTSTPMGTWRIDGDQFLVGCADGALRLDEIQLPGKRRMASSDVLRGYRGELAGTCA
jgi:methionyl-tRNA formyltransferase